MRRLVLVLLVPLALAVRASAGSCEDTCLAYPRVFTERECSKICAPGIVPPPGTLLDCEALCQYPNGSCAKECAHDNDELHERNRAVPSPIIGEGDGLARAGEW